MGFLSKLFGSGKKFDLPLKWDMHNHILFGIDDGSKSLGDSMEMARKYVDHGYKKVIATPHVMSDYYPNTRAGISEKKELLEKALNENHLPLELDFAAEYYMDEVFYEKIRNKEDLLSMRGNHVLIETSFMNKPVFFTQLMFDVRTLGYTPILAHPERYIYLQENYEEVETLMQSGIKLQINLLALSGHYSPGAKKLAQWMIKNGYYHFLGTDAHNINHLNMLSDVFSSKLFASIDFDRVENAR